MLENTLESPMDCEEIKLVCPKWNKPWIFIGRTDTEVEASILWSPDANSQLIGKDTDAQKDWRQGGKGMTEDKMVGWHHWLNGHEFEQTSGDGQGQEAWLAAVNGVTKSRTQLSSNWTTTIRLCQVVVGSILLIREAKKPKARTDQLSPLANSTCLLGKKPLTEKLNTKVNYEKLKNKSRT